MKTHSVFLILLVLALPVFGQLTSNHNRYRPGDVLIKQQVEFADPGESGANKIWNFSKLKTIKEEYTLRYNLPPLEGDSVYIHGGKRYRVKNVFSDELITGIEHNTMYYYRQTGDSLLLLGHENPSVKLNYDPSIQQMRFPMNYGQTVSSNYDSKGLYSGTVKIQTKGIVTTWADAYGKLILPSGDSLNPVLRVMTVQTIEDLTGKANTNIKALETCRWYSKGYRYPVFETVRNINVVDSTVIFTTAFFYPPQEHLYLDTDPENQALLDELWKETENNQNNATNADNQKGKTVTLDDIMTCKIYPNPVESQMYLEYELKEDAKVGFELYSIDGIPVRKLQSKARAKGVTYNETIDCSALKPKSYVLRVTANGAILNEVVIKK